MDIEMMRGDVHFFNNIADMLNIQGCRFSQSFPTTPLSLKT